MSSERASLAQVIRQEFAEQLAASQEESQRAKAELAELRARQQMELDEVHRRWVVRTSGGAQGAVARLPFSSTYADSAQEQELAWLPALCSGRLGIVPLGVT